MSYRSLEHIDTFEHFNLDFDHQSSVRLVNHRFIEDTVVENIFLPGLYISMLGKCQCKTTNDHEIKQLSYDHQYVIALVDKPSESQLHFPHNSVWQSFTIMLPLGQLNAKAVLPKLRGNFRRTESRIKSAELGPVPSDILRCCEAAWNCTFEGFERELFIKAKAQEVLALFLHKRREQHQVTTTSRITQLSNVLSHIQTNLAQDWPLSTVANLAGSNRTYVKQDIKELVGISFRDWLKEARLEAAREQLAGNEPITQIAHNIGFKSQAHFATLFKAEVGATPSEYRQSLLM